MELTENQKNNLLTLLSSYAKDKSPSLFPVFEEVMRSVELGTIIDAYQARYIRDAIYSSDENKENFKEIDEKLVELFF